ncbi:hypothetical protein DGo_PE0059 (plasmid) [Deinococcus gobiensis I-0]|uniref:Uncharacterized protein n=1 Tax=Deinococcus gobiensis (strain DSM 21396 / JCM 16679 / CGMCC 1.7299 / I-0) TaxID=745776 RepID=H8H3V6_DEIGI|nr:hypothetical protein DGo_PE0059 [Deinococcus gobiensis I-0]
MLAGAGADLQGLAAVGVAEDLDLVANLQAQGEDEAVGRGVGLCAVVARQGQAVDLGQRLGKGRELAHALGADDADVWHLIADARRQRLAAARAGPGRSMGKGDGGRVEAGGGVGHDGGSDSPHPGFRCDWRSDGGIGLQI